MNPAGFDTARYTAEPLRRSPSELGQPPHFGSAAEQCLQPHLTPPTGLPGSRRLPVILQASRTTCLLPAASSQPSVARRALFSSPVIRRRTRNLSHRLSAS